MTPDISSSTITILLDAWGQGNKEAFLKLIEKTYKTLYSIARAQLADERRNHTLNPTALINEAFIKLDGLPNPRLQNRTQYYALCGVIIRHILTGYARRRNRKKRGEGQPLLSFDEELVDGGNMCELITLDEGLKELALLDPRKALIVEIRFFGGLSIQETADVLNLSAPTIKRDLRLAKSWLFRYMTPGLEP